MWTEEVVACFEVLYRKIPGGTKGNKEKSVKQGVLK
jgi:hypothetical protein